MPTDNPRVAAYVPVAVYDRLKEFKDSRKLKSDSQAIVTILSEFLEVSQVVAYQSSSELGQRVESLEEKLIHVKNELLSELQSELLRLVSSISLDERLASLEASLTTVHQVQAGVKDELLSELQGELFKENQATIEATYFEGPESETSELDSSSGSELNRGSQIEPLSAVALSRRLRLPHPDRVAQAKHRFKGKPEKLTRWLQDHDPECVAWEYREDTKLYHPVIEGQRLIG